MSEKRDVFTANPFQRAGIRREILLFIGPRNRFAVITVKNILRERFARNGTVVRILNKFPDPPNKDVGEGLNTAFEAMQHLRLKAPIISENQNSVLVVIKHEPLASPEEAIMDYLVVNDSINNSVARKVTHVRADYQMKNIFRSMVDKGLIEQVAGTPHFRHGISAR